MILRGRWIVPINSIPFEHGAVVVHEDRILDFGPAPEIELKYPAELVRDFSNAAIMPGFVNVHTHLELTVLRGYLEDLPFWDWIQKLTRTKYQILARDEIAASALLGAVEAIRAGITTVGDPMDLGGSLDAVLTSGLRGVLYQECFSPKPQEAKKTLVQLTHVVEGLERRIKDWPLGNPFLGLVSCPPKDWGRRCDRVRLGVSPHSPYTVSQPLFQGVKEFAEARRMPLCVHVAESAAESDLLEEGTGPIMQSYRARNIQWTPPYCSPVQYLERIGILQETVLLVHCVRATDSDFDVVKSRNASVAHCPKSNWKLGHGSMNLKAAHQKKIRLGLGSDSVASNNTMDFFEEMRFTAFNPSWQQEQTNAETQDRMKGLAAQDLLRIATLGGAEALGISENVGSIEIGKQADLIAVDLSKPHVQPVFSPTTALVYSAKASDVTMTMVGGEIVFDECGVRGVDEKALYQRTQAIREKMLDAPRQN
jgi:5-methylthioadenosine/S-adenosylhomocysteine deaminase